MTRTTKNEYVGTLRRCPNAEPHAAHPHGGSYSTVRYGVLERYCPGCGELAARVVSRGSAESAPVLAVPVTTQEAA